MRRAFSIMGMAAAQAAVLAAAACGLAPDGSDSPIPRPAPSEVTSLTVVQGHVTDTSGKPIAGADVYAQLSPSDHVESSLKVGDTVPMHRIGTLSTGADGRFAFTLDPATVPVDFRNGTGDDAYVQLEVLVAGSRGSAAWHLTAYTAVPWATPMPAALTRCGPCPRIRTTCRPRESRWSSSSTGRATSAPTNVP